MSETTLQTARLELICRVKDVNNLDLCHVAHTYYEKSQEILHELLCCSV